MLAGMSEGLSANGLLQRALIGVMQVGLYGPPCGDYAGRDLYHGIVRQILRLGDVGAAEALIVGTPEVGASVIEEGNRAREMMRVDPTLSDNGGLHCHLLGDIKVRRRYQRHTRGHEPEERIVGRSANRGVEGRRPPFH